MLLAWLVAPGLLGAAPDAFNMVWDSPSRDHHGSMPLGNGDIALNAWMTSDGDLHFYIGKTDAWDDQGRLVKVGKVRVHFEPSLLSAGARFRQELNLAGGEMEIRIGRPAGAAGGTAANAAGSPAPAAAAAAGAGAGGSTVRLWVDAQHPVIEVTAETAVPVTATAFVELWRTNRREIRSLEVSDVLQGYRTPEGKPATLIVEPDTVFAGLRDRVGWCHHNIKSVGPQLLAETQGLTGFPQPDPLLHRTFGALVSVVGGERLDDLRLRSPLGTRHRFGVVVLTRHPSTPERWREEAENLARRIESLDFDARRAEHGRWWNAFWGRSWIRASAASGAAGPVESMVPTNRHPVRVGCDQEGGNRFAGELGRVSVLSRALDDAEVAALAGLARDGTAPAQPGLVSSVCGPEPGARIEEWAGQPTPGLTLEAWVRPEALPGSGARIVDKITPGGSDGFLLDTHPGNSLRFICGEAILQRENAVPAGRWTHVAAVADSAGGGCRLYVEGQRVAETTGGSAGDEAALVSQMYHLQRFITACAGRGAYPIKFNGSLFTVPPGPTAADPDYRRWGPGYWWQNTRLPYLSLCASGDIDLMRPLFRMYADELLPLCKYRTRHYLGHDGAFYPECIHFWGAIFGETYGWTPFAQRADKLQESGWHKWEWVGGLELCWLMLDAAEYTEDTAFLRQTALPFAREILTFFDQHYPTNAQGELVMHPSQALETWWRCTNAMPELAGCRAVTERLLALPAEIAPPADRALWRQLHGKLPPLPLRTVNGRTALAPAATYDQKSNIENPELYAVFPFRLIAVGKPNLDWGIAALEHRWDRGHSGWRQDDLFMAYLGLADDARKNLVARARSHDPNERFPAFWGPNYDWTPDQDHGGVLMKALQAMLLQADGRRLFLFPAWPRHWDVEFKLDAPYRTTIEGVYRGGRLETLRVTPEARRADVVIEAR